RTLLFFTLITVPAAQSLFAITRPTGLRTRPGDLSLVLHWDKNSDANLAGYRVYRSLNSGGPFVAQSPNLITSPGFCDIAVNNGTTYYYQVTALTTSSQESSPSVTIAAVPRAFANDDQ